MPRIVARGFKKEDLKKVSAELFDTIAEIIERPREAFTLDLIESVAILDGEEISRANLEIGWVHRPVEVCEKVATSKKPFFLCKMKCLFLKSPRTHFCGEWFARLLAR